MYGYARGMQGRLGFCGSYLADVGLRPTAGNTNSLGVAPSISWRGT